MPGSGHESTVALASAITAGRPSVSPRTRSTDAWQMSAFASSSGCPKERNSATPRSRRGSASSMFPSSRQRLACRHEDLAVHPVDAVFSRELHRVVGQRRLFLDAPALTGDQRTVCHRRHTREPLLARGCELRRLRVPAIGFGGVSTEVVAHADRPADDRPPGRLRVLELRRSARVVERRAHVTPRKASPERRQARFDRAEAVGQRSGIEMPQLLDPRDGLRRVVAHRAERQHPGVNEEQPLVVAPELHREPLQPRENRRVPGHLCVLDPRGFDLLAGLGERPSLERMLDRFVDGAVIPVPYVCPAMERRGKPRLAMLELDAQQLREEMMEAVPLPSGRPAARGTGSYARARSGVPRCPPVRARRRRVGRRGV